MKVRSPSGSAVVVGPGLKPASSAMSRVDLTRDRLDLRAAARAHDDLPAIARQRTRDPRSDPAAATGYERSHRTPPYCAPQGDRIAGHAWFRELLEDVHGMHLSEVSSDYRA